MNILYHVLIAVLHLFLASRIRAQIQVNGIEIYRIRTMGYGPDLSGTQAFERRYRQPRALSAQARAFRLTWFDPILLEL